MLEYAALRAQYDPKIELYAVAVSTDHGGSALSVRDAGIHHYEECSQTVSPIRADAPTPPLDASRMHRMETLDPAEYAQVVNMGRPERSMMWPLTEAMVGSVLVRASSLPGLSVPAVIRDVASALSDDKPISEQQWAELDAGRLHVTLDSASARPGRLPESEGASPYARAYYSLARVAELLQMWRGAEPEYVEIAYIARQISKEAELSSG
jgi:hypothetical protein